MHKALFLDRDGVINIDHGYVSHPERVEFLSGLFDFCRAAHARGYLLIIVTNQAGIARGLYDEAQFHGLMAWMKERFELEGAPVAAYYFCPHHPDFTGPCECRKPAPGMVLEAIKEHNIDPAQSMLIGDKESDLEAGRAAGVGRVELFSGSWPAL